MGLPLSRRFGRGAHLFPSSVSLFDPFFSPRPELRSGRRAQVRSRLVVAPTLRHARPLLGRADDQRGARFRGADQSRHNLVFGGSKTRTMMQPCASAAKLRSGGPILPLGMTAMSHLGTPPPRTVIGDQSQAYGLGRNCRVPSVTSVHYAWRRTTPSGTTPSRTSRHRAISSLRAKATIMGFRVRRAFSVRDRNHFVKALALTGAP